MTSTAPGNGTEDISPALTGRGARFPAPAVPRTAAPAKAPTCQPAAAAVPRGPAVRQAPTAVVPMLDSLRRSCCSSGRFEPPRDDLAMGLVKPTRMDHASAGRGGEEHAQDASCLLKAATTWAPCAQFPQPICACYRMTPPKLIAFAAKGRRPAGPCPAPPHTSTSMPATLPFAGSQAMLRAAGQVGLGAAGIASARSLET